jgi:HPt (histidine-containing phosphotransfer) domain-containing protein
VNSNNLPLDMRVIGELREIMGNDFSLLIDTFVNDSAVRFADLEKALQSTDGEALRRSAHSFKGSAGNLGAKHLAEVCRQLEVIGLENRLEEAPFLMEKLRKHYDQAEQALRSMT